MKMEQAREKENQRIMREKEEKEMMKIEQER